MGKEDKKIIIPTQIEPTDFVRRTVVDFGIPHVSTPEDLVLLRSKMYSVLTIRPYNDETKEAERQIRWKRTGLQVLEDRYVYQGKACTDLVVTLFTLAKAGGVKDTRFVKLKNNDTGKVHSVGEFELNDGWYTFDVANSKAVPTKGTIEADVPFGGPPNGPYLLWKKGRDSWDLGLTEFDTISKIKV